MVACPACKSRVYTHREILHSSLDGGATCPACGEVARLDQMSRCVVACLLAVLLWQALLYGGMFFSGYFFVFSMIVILGGWRLLSAVALPLLALEKSPDGPCLNRKQSLVAALILIVTAIGLDTFLSYRIDSDAARTTAATSSPEARSR